MQLYERLLEKKEKLSLVGLGYVGMPIAVASCERAPTQPSLCERTTTGLSFRSGRKTRSQES